MKAVVLARGRGTRMRRQDEGPPLSPEQEAMADLGVKAMIPFGRPFLDYVLGALADAGCLDVCLVVAPGDAIVREYYTSIRPARRVRVSFAVQAQPLGTADSVIAARAFTGGDPFLVLNSDNYYPPAVFEALIRLDEPGLPAFRRSALIRTSNIDPERVRAYAVLQVGPDLMLQDIIEKPDARTLAAFGEDFYVSMNCWRFDAGIFDACRAIAPSERGEIELPNAVRHAVRVMGMRVHAIPCDAPILDLSRRADIPEVARRLAGIEANP